MKSSVSETLTPYNKTVFPNGSRLILVPMDGLESVATCVMVNVGSRFETLAINGASHFLEHMVFKGTKKYPTTDDVNFIERMGGLQNAYTDIDVTSFHNKVMASDWKSALEINKELALYPRLEEKHVNRERDVILEEVKKYEDEPAIKVGEVFHEMMYPGTKLGMRVIGREKSLRKTNSGTLRTYHDQWYQPERTVVVVAGKLKTEDRNQVTGQVKEWFGALNSTRQSAEVAGYPAGEKVLDSQKKPAVSILTKPDAQQAHITLGVRTFARNSMDRFVWNVFNILFGISFTSRLFKEIREKRGLCYTIRSASDNWDDVGYWSIYAGVATVKVKEAVSAIISELEKVKDGGVTEDEVAVAQKRIITMLSFKTEDPEFMAEYYGKQELYHLPIMTIDQYIREIRGVTSQKVNNLLRKYFVQKYLNLAVVWNKPKDENLVDLLKI
jgi:predicted Zn-dependent peptidase